jgi:hypothetical protein
VHLETISGPEKMREGASYEKDADHHWHGFVGAGF